MSNPSPVEALNQCAAWFTEYADEHTAKGATEKAQRNRERAGYCHQVVLIHEHSQKMAVDRGADALRHFELVCGPGGVALKDWALLPTATKNKWREKARVVLGISAS